MLAYLEELCTALLAHDATATHRLLAHPLARSLPRQVREEALAISRATPSNLRAPIQTLRFYHQTLQLAASDHPTDSAGSDSPEADSDAHIDSRPQYTPDTAFSAAVTTREIVIDAEPRDQIELPFEYSGAAAA